tara:strand:+ start:12141 stop:12959 length:819 start_codon:yes stop_codon:yes gene_type:complete
MSTYAIGDLQGCLDPLKQLLDKIAYDPNHDQLWFTGDLINRGPQSLETLRYVASLPSNTIVVLGNHDLTLLAAYYGYITPNQNDTYQEILSAPDAASLIDWLCHKPLLHHDSRLNFVMSHAGIYPFWDLNKTKALALEAESRLRSETEVFLKNMYGNEPNVWQDDLSDWARIRFVVNAFTRMRFCSPNGQLDFSKKGTLDNPPKDGLPWFSLKNRINIQAKIVFGHWAALAGKCHAKDVFVVDSGCVWGNALMAMCLETEQTTLVACQNNKI